MNKDKLKFIRDTTLRNQISSQFEQNKPSINQVLLRRRIREDAKFYTSSVDPTMHERYIKQEMQRLTLVNNQVYYYDEARRREKLINRKDSKNVDQESQHQNLMRSLNNIKKSNNFTSSTLSDKHNKYLSIMKILNDQLNNNYTNNEIVIIDMSRNEFFKMSTTQFLVSIDEHLDFLKNILMKKIPLGDRYIILFQHDKSHEDYNKFDDLHTHSKPLMLVSAQNEIINNIKRLISPFKINELTDLSNDIFDIILKMEELKQGSFERFIDKENSKLVQIIFTTYPDPIDITRNDLLKLIIKSMNSSIIKLTRRDINIFRAKLRQSMLNLKETGEIGTQRKERLKKRRESIFPEDPKDPENLGNDGDGDDIDEDPEEPVKEDPEEPVKEDPEEPVKEDPPVNQQITRDNVLDIINEDLGKMKRGTFKFLVDSEQKKLKQIIDKLNVFKSKDIEKTINQSFNKVLNQLIGMNDSIVQIKLKRDSLRTTIRKKKSFDKVKTKKTLFKTFKLLIELNIYSSYISNKNL